MHTSSNAILPVGFGLQARKGVVREDKMIRTEVQIALKTVRFFVGRDRKCLVNTVFSVSYVPSYMHTPHYSASNLRSKRCLQTGANLYHMGSMFGKITVHYVQVKGMIHVTNTRNR